MCPSAVAEGRPLSAADVKTLRHPISCLLARVRVYIYGDDGLDFLLLFFAAEHCRVEHYCTELSLSGEKKAPLSLHQLPGGRGRIPTVISLPYSPGYQVGLLGRFPVTLKLFIIFFRGLDVPSGFPHSARL